MKRIGYLYETIISIDNCREAIIEASKHKTKRKCVVRILNDIDFYSNDLSNRLKELNFNTPMTYRPYFDVNRKKTRDVYVPSFYPDQCAHHAIIRVLSESILRSSYKWSCANLPDRGLDYGCRKMTDIMKHHYKDCKYCLKLDVHHFYESVDHEVLMTIINKKFKDKKAIKLLETLINYHPKGLPIGNYSSCWLAELMLQDLDHFIEQDPTALHYVRYADDIVIIGKNKKNLHKLRIAIKNKLKSMKLKMKDNWQVFLIYDGVKGRKIDFMGRCFSPSCITIRKRRTLSMSRCARKIINKNYNITPKRACSYISKSACVLRGVPYS